MNANKRGSILHDGWSKNGAHYAGIFATCIRKKFKCLKKGAKMFEDETVIVLLACSPLGNADVDGKYNEKYVAMQSNILV